MTQQIPLPLDPGSRPVDFVHTRHTMQPTSIDAHQSVESRETLRARVLAALEDAGDYGATDQELQAILGMHEQTQGPRRHELVALGKVRNSGKRRPTRSGRTAIVWVAV